MCTVIVTIIVIKLATVQLHTNLGCWRNSASASPFSALSIHLYMGGPVVTFCSSMIFWTMSTKMIHSSRVTEANLGILITYFPEVLSLGVLWRIWSIYSKASSSSFSSLARGMINLTNLLGWVLVFWGICFVCLVNLAMYREVTLLCPNLKIGWRKTL